MTNECINKMEKLVWDKLYNILRQIESKRLYQYKNIKCDIEWIKYISKHLNMDDKIQNSIDIIEISIRKPDISGDLFKEFGLQVWMQSQEEDIERLKKEDLQNIKDKMKWKLDME